MATILRETMDNPNIIKLDLAKLVNSNDIQYCKEEHERRIRDMIMNLPGEDIRIVILALKDRLK